MTSMSGAALFTVWISRWLTTAYRCPSTSAYRKGSMISAGTSWRSSGERIVSAQIRTKAMLRVLHGRLRDLLRDRGRALGHGGIGVALPHGGVSWLKLARRQTPQRFDDPLCIVCGNGLAARLGGDAASLGPGGERQDGWPGGEVLEELEVQELRSARGRDQEQCIGRALESQRLRAAEGAGDDDPGGRHVGAHQRRLIVRKRSGDHELELRGLLGMLARERAQSDDQSRRVATVAAEAARVDERDPVWVEYALGGRTIGGCDVEVRVPAVRDQHRIEAEPGTQVLGGGPADADDGIGCG